MGAGYTPVLGPTVQACHNCSHPHQTVAPAPPPCPRRTVAYSERLWQSLCKAEEPHHLFREDVLQGGRDRGGGGAGFAACLSHVRVRPGDS